MTQWLARRTAGKLWELIWQLHIEPSEEMINEHRERLLTFRRRAAAYRKLSRRVGEDALLSITGGEDSIPELRASAYQTGDRVKGRQTNTSSGPSGFGEP